MKKPISQPGETIGQAAAKWVLRHDRGLSAAEQDEFSQWMAADARHREAFALHRWGWEEVDRLIGIQTTVHAAPDPDLLAAPRRFHRAKIIWIGSLGLAAAASVAVMFFLPAKNRAPTEPAPLVFATAIEQHTLEDGSVVELNRGAEIAVHFTPGERRMQLVRGEANFQVAKNKERPFIVSAGDVDVRAVGTVFDVRLGASAVEVVVTEGRVQVDRPSAEAIGDTPVVVPELKAGQCTLVSLAPTTASPTVTTLNGTELQKRLAWQPRLMDFTDASLADIVAEFNRSNSVQVFLEQPAIGAMRLSVSFRSDNIKGFVRLMESDFGLQAEQRGNNILLRKAR